MKPVAPPIEAIGAHPVADKQADEKPAEPAVLLFDEPLSNLDARLRRSMREAVSYTHLTLPTILLV